MSEHTVLCALQSGVADLPALVGVSVFSAPMGDETAFTLETVEFGSQVQADESDLAMQKRMDEYDIDATIIVVRPGAGEDVAQEARRRALDLRDAVRAFVDEDPTLNGACLRARFLRGDLEQHYGPEGRGCLCTFTIHVQETR